MPLENIIMQAYIVYGNKQSHGPGPAATIEQDLQKLGLRLESTKEATGFIVIDHIERPSAN